jgi:hypothetical protein
MGVASHESSITGQCVEQMPHSVALTVNAGLAEKTLPFIQHAFENVGLCTERGIMFRLKGGREPPIQRAIEAS